ncbi:MAG: hypothetical protein GSR72_03600 [Desulfurococcales archaeon]|nr:hypothetical protein [Desulfurococcales archaeon]
MKKAVISLVVLILLVAPLTAFLGQTQDGDVIISPEGPVPLGGYRYPGEARYPLKAGSPEVALVRSVFYVWVKNGSLEIGLKDADDEWLAGPLVLENTSVSYGGEDKTIYAFGGIRIQFDLWRDWHIIVYLFHKDLLVASFDLGPTPDLANTGLNMSFTVPSGSALVVHQWTKEYYYPVVPSPLETARSMIPDKALVAPGSIVEAYRYGGVLALRDPSTLKLKCAFDVLDDLLDYTFRGYEASLVSYSFYREEIGVVMSLWNPFSQTPSVPDGFMVTVLNSSSCNVERAVIFDDDTLGIKPTRVFLSGPSTAVLVDEEIIYDPYGRRIGNISLFEVLDLTTGSMVEYNTSGQIAYWGSDPQSGVTAALTADSLYIIWPNGTVTISQVESPVQAPWLTGSIMGVKSVLGTLLMNVGGNILYYYNGALTQLEPDGYLYSIAEDNKHYYILTQAYSGETVWRITVITPGAGEDYLDLPLSQYTQVALGNGIACAHLALQPSTASSTVEEASLCGTEYTVEWSRNMSINNIYSAGYGWVNGSVSIIRGVEAEILFNAEKALLSGLSTGGTTWDYVALYSLQDWAVLAARPNVYQDLLIISLDPSKGSRIVGVSSELVKPVEWVNNNGVIVVSYEGGQIQYMLITRDGTENITLPPPQEGTLKGLGPAWGPGAVAVTWVDNYYRATLYYPGDNTSLSINLTIPPEAYLQRVVGVNHTVLALAKIGGNLALYWKDSASAWSGEENLSSLLAEKLMEILPIRHPEDLQTWVSMYDLRLSPTGEYALVTVWARFLLNGMLIGNGTLYALVTDRGLETLDFIDYNGLAAGWIDNNTLAIPASNKVYRVPGPVLVRDLPDTLPPIVATVVLAVSQTPDGGLVVPYLFDPSYTRSYSVPAIVSEDGARIYYGSVDNLGGRSGVIAGVWAGDVLIAARLFPSLSLKASLHTAQVSGPYMIKTLDNGSYQVLCPQGNVKAWFGPSQALESIECNTTITAPPGYEYYVALTTPQSHRDSYSVQILNLTLTPTPGDIDSTLTFLAVLGEQECIEYTPYTNYTIALLDDDPILLTPQVDKYHEPGTQYVFCYTLEEPGNHTLLLLSLEPNGDVYYAKQYKIITIPRTIELQQPITTSQPEPTPGNNQTNTSNPPTQTETPPPTSQETTGNGETSSSQTTQPPIQPPLSTSQTTTPQQPGTKTTTWLPWIILIIILIGIVTIYLAKNKIYDRNQE